MRDFTFYIPTQIFFGQGSLKHLGEQVRRYAQKILLLYGKGSIKKNGIYQAVVTQLQEHGIDFVELGGVDPNPRISTVRAGAEMCRQAGLEFVLAVGGGSAIDCAKGIAAATLYQGDPWDFWAYTARPERALPIGAVLTLSATGSEMNSGAVLTNEETLDKRGMSGPALFPRFSILDPSLTFTVPPEHTAAGVADIMAHVYEFYFSPVEHAYLQDGFAEAILRTCVRYGPIAYREPENYAARANLMWASSMGLNGVVSAGKLFDGFNHLVEHAISGLYDLTHGVGLAILATHWMEYVLNEETLGKFVAFARNVWGIQGGGDFETARAGIRATAEFYRGLGLPLQLSEVGIGDERFEEIVAKSVRGETLGQVKKLTREDVLHILGKAS